MNTNTPDTTSRADSGSAPSGSGWPVAYTGTVTAVAAALVPGAASLVVAVAVLLATGAPARVLVSASLVDAVGVVACMALLGRLQIGISPREVRYRTGWAPWHVITWDRVEQVAVKKVGIGAVIGAEARPRVREYRHIVTTGPVLHLGLHDGPDYWLSVPRSATTDVLAAVLPTHDPVIEQPQRDQ